MADAFADIEVFNGVPSSAPMSAQQTQVTTDVAAAAADQQRAIAEVQASLIIAQNCPRNELKARERLLIACQRLRLAEGALYSYKRGGAEVTGPSIRLAEAAARYYGNLEYGFREVSRHPGESEVEAYCWDKETNTRVSRRFTVRHVQYSGARATSLKTEREIYEAIASQAQRRVRSAILAIVPGDIIDDAIDACQTTLNAAIRDLPGAIRKMVQCFEGKGISRAMIEKRFGRKCESLNASNILSLRRIWSSLADNMSKPEEWFDMSLREEPAASPARAQAPAAPVAPAAEHPAPSAQDAPVSQVEDSSPRKRSRKTVKTAEQAQEPAALEEPAAQTQENAVPPEQQDQTLVDDFQNYGAYERCRDSFSSECAFAGVKESRMVEEYRVQFGGTEKEAIIQMGTNSQIFDQIAELVGTAI